MSESQSSERMEDRVYRVSNEIPPSDQGSLLVLALASREATLERVGGKGASLARLTAAGFPVPPGFHITTAAYRRFVTENDLQNAILSAAGQVRPGEPASFERASTRIQALFAGSKMPDDVTREIRTAYAALAAGDPAVAVRSSATAEDLPGMSFAGQQETYLNVQGEVELLDAVRRCWASLWTARAIAYRARQGITPDQVSLAVVVQRLVPADAAGVLFTANPVSGRREEAIINAAWGLGESIVGGLVTPDTITADKSTGSIIAEQIADKETMTVRTAGGTSQAPAPDELRRKPVLDPGQVAELVGLGRRIEDLYGRPQDVEWAIHDGRLFLLQARPITTLPESRPSLEWTLPRAGGRYARASVVELLPDPLTPLFASLALPSFNDAMHDLGLELGVGEVMDAYRLVTINDYAYYDFGLTSAEAARFAFSYLRAIRTMLPLLKNAERRWAGEARPAYAATVRQWEEQDIAEARAVALVNGARQIVRAATHHYVTIQSGILPVAYLGETLFSTSYNRLVRRRGDPPALTFLLGYDSAPIRAEKSLYDLAQWARTQGGLGAYLAQTPSAEVARAWRTPPAHLEEAEGWPEFRRRFTDHLARFGHAIYDLDFAKPTPFEEPEPLLDALKFFLSGEAPSPYDRQSGAAATREQATRDTLARLRGRRLALFRRTLRLAQRYAPLREDALADAGLGWPVLRRMLLEIGRRLADSRALAAAEDVFWLQVEELETAANALDSGRPQADYRPRVAERQARWTEERKTTPPAALPPREGARFLGFDFSAFLPARTEQAQGETIRGIGTSPGRVAGDARVIHGPEEFDQMKHGDILIAKITTPAWTPLFILAAGVVTDVGGPLSHGSIVAREYHIPAVLGTGVATERIRSGERVEVDGDAGTVTLAHPGIERQAATRSEGMPVAPRERPARPVAKLGLLAVVVLLTALVFHRRRPRS